MAYYSQERKAVTAPKIKAILQSYGLKGTLSVRNKSTIVLTIRSGGVDFLSEYTDRTDDQIRVNPYHYKSQFNGHAYHCLNHLFEVLNDGNHDRSDVQSDYFDVGWYVDVNIGEWDLPYKYIA